MALQGVHAETLDKDAALPLKLCFSDTELILRGVGTAHFLGVVKIYKAALYLPEHSTRQDLLNQDTPIHFEIEYLHSFDRDQLVAAGDKFFYKNLGEHRLHDLSQPLDQLNSLYRSVRKGDKASLTYLPGQGLSLAFNGKTAGIVKNDRFAVTYLRVWLGNDPVSPDLKQKLLENIPRS